jgi:hypothetical protein
MSTDLLLSILRRLPKGSGVCGSSIFCGVEYVSVAYSIMPIPLSAMIYEDFTLYSNKHNSAVGTVQFYHTHPYSKDVHRSVAFHPEETSQGQQCMWQ